MREFCRNCERYFDAGGKQQKVFWYCAVPVWSSILEMSVFVCTRYHSFPDQALESMKKELGSRLIIRDNATTVTSDVERMPKGSILVLGTGPTSSQTVTVDGNLFRRCSNGSAWCFFSPSTSVAQVCSYLRGE